MRYNLGEEIQFKKKHACGGDVWIVNKIGATIKLECKGCNRLITLLPIDIDKRKKPK